LSNDLVFTAAFCCFCVEQAQVLRHVRGYTIFCLFYDWRVLYLGGRLLDRPLQKLGQAFRGKVPERTVCVVAHGLAGRKKT
jgi:hypothetical protein